MKIVDIKLCDNDLIYISDVCDNFINNGGNPDGESNFYFRKLIPKINLVDLQHQLMDYIEENYSSEYYINGIWVNQITPDSNKNDDFHQDNSELTFLFFLNDKFVGGEFEYITDTHTKVIKPEVGMCLLMDNKTPHRVKPVKSGVRYSLVVFVSQKQKQNKSLI